MDEFTATIARLERMRSSHNGNPKFRVIFDNGQSYETKTDAMVGYKISEYYVGREVKVTLQPIGHGRVQIIDINEP